MWFQRIFCHNIYLVKNMLICGEFLLLFFLAGEKWAVHLNISILFTACSISRMDYFIFDKFELVFFFQNVFQHIQGHTKRIFSMNIIHATIINPNPTRFEKPKNYVNIGQRILSCFNKHSSNYCIKVVVIYFWGNIGKSSWQRIKLKLVRFLRWINICNSKQWLEIWENL